MLNRKLKTTDFNLSSLSLLYLSKSLQLSYRYRVLHVSNCRGELTEVEFGAVDQRMCEIPTAAACSHTCRLPLLTIGHNSSMVFSSGDSLKQNTPNIGIKGTLPNSVLIQQLNEIYYFLFITISSNIYWFFYGISAKFFDSWSKAK